MTRFFLRGGIVIETSGLIATTKPYFEHHGYGAGGVLPAGIGIPTPGEPALMAATFLAFGGDMSPLGVFAVVLFWHSSATASDMLWVTTGGRLFIIRYG